MTPRERFRRLMNFQPVDRIPWLEWATWWDKTIARWKTEGLPEQLEGEAIWQYFGLDLFPQHWQNPRRESVSNALAEHGPITDMASYDRIRDHLYPRESLRDDSTRRRLEEIARRQEAGECVFWITLEGFFWFPRTLFGIERHLYAFYDHPDVMHAMNEDLLAFHMDTLDAICDTAVPDFMTFAEDMSYRSGPMCSRAHFDEFMAPYYRRLTPLLRERGIRVFVDTDGDCTEPAGWFLEVGVEGMLPLERQAGVDPVRLRKLYPGILMIGGFDKMTMNQGEAAMRSVFEALLPVMRQGGFIPACDHQTPPGVSLSQYREYLALLREYCARGAPQAEDLGQ